MNVYTEEQGVRSVSDDAPFTPNTNAFIGVSKDAKK